MRTLKVIIAGFVAAALAPSAGHAATTTQFFSRGVGIDADVGYVTPDGCTAISVSIDADTPVDRPDNTSGGEAVVAVFRDDICNFTFHEVGFGFIPFTTELTMGSGNRSATFN